MKEDDQKPGPGREPTTPNDRNETVGVPDLPQTLTFGDLWAWLKRRKLLEIGALLGVFAGLVSGSFGLGVWSEQLRISGGAISPMKSPDLGPPKIGPQTVSSVPSLGGKSASEVNKAISPSCKDIPGWPVGEWYNWGRFDNAPTKKNTDGWTRIPQVYPIVDIASDHSYDGRTEEHVPDGESDAIQKYHAEAINGTRIAPGARVSFHGNDGTGYFLDEDLHVSLDGCFMWGHETDSSKNSGAYFYLYKKAHPQE